MKQEEQLEQPKRKRAPGGGRKPKGGELGTIRIGMRISKDVHEILKKQPNMTAFIEQAIKEKYRRDSYH